VLTQRCHRRSGRPLIACSLGAAVLLAIPARLDAQATAPPPADAPARPSAGGVYPAVEVVPHLQPCAQRFAALHAGAGRFAQRSMIATLPDPLDSAFGREFDTFYLAVQQAMASEGFLPDRSCPTWGAAGDQMPAVPAGGDDPGAATGPLHRRQPSALIFRRSAAGDRPAEVYALLVVGELLNTGVQADAMARALELVEPGQPFAAVTADGRPGPVQILGPAFSGSVDSLAVALESWRWGAAAAEPASSPPPAPLEVVIRSGTATNTGLHRVLADSLAGAGQRFVLAPFRSAGSSNDDLQGCAWNRLVPERLGLATRWRRIGDDGEVEAWPEDHPCAPTPLSTGQDNTRVALLVELSAYGRQFARRGFRVVDFPPHIAALRKAYQEARRRQQPDPGGRPSEPSALPSDLPLELRPLALQGLPAFGGLATLTSQDLVLNNALRQLARDRVQLVGIIATSIEDKLFLTEKVRTFAPDVRVLTFEGDVLLTHPQSYTTTAGMLVISSHPLTDPDPVAALPASRGDSRVSLRFDFDGAQGLSLAVSHLVRDDRGEPRHRVWASAVGKNRLAPIALYDLAGGDRPTGQAAGPPARAGDAVRAAVLGGAAVDPTARPFTPSELPTMWRLLLFLITLLLGVAALAVRGDLRARRPLLGLVPIDLVRPSRWRTPEDSDRILHALVVLFPVALGDLYFVLAFPALAAGSMGVDSESMAVAGMPGGVLTSVASACLLSMLCANVYLLAGLGTRTVQDLARFEPPSTGRRRRLRAIEGRARIAAPLVGALVLSLVLAFAGLRAIARIWYGDAVGGTLLVRRALALTGGVSPLLPALLMGGVVLAWVLLALHRRETLCRIAPRHGDPRVSADDGHGGLCRALWQAIDPLTDGRAVLRWVVVLELVPLFYLCSLYEPRTWLTPVLRSMEGTGFDLAISALLGTAILVSIAAGVSLLRGWRVLRELVRSIAGDVDMDRVRDPRLAPSLEPLERALERDGGEGAAELRRGLDESGGWLTTRWLAVDRWRRRHPAKAEATELDRAAAAFHARGAAYLVRIAAEQLRYMMVFLTVALLALFLAVSAYPFEPRRMILVYLGGLIVLAAALSVLVILQVDKEKELVELAGFGKGSTGWSAMLQRLGFFAGLPALSLLAGRFPELRLLLGNWLGPLVEAVK
jgi:hypothetical protein